MPSRLDELFDPERLRRGWETPQPPAAAPAPDGPCAAVQARHRELLGWLNQRYPEAPALRSLLAELSGRIDAAFPEDAAAPTAEAKEKAEIVALLERLEETLMALDLAKAGR